MSESRFNVIIDEPLRSEVVIIPKQWAKGKVVKRRVMAGIGTKKDDEQPWVSLGLVISIKDPEIAALVGQDEVKLEYSPYIGLDKSGRAENSNQNVNFSQMLKLCGVDLSDPDVREVLITTVEAAKTDEDKLKAYYEKLGDLCTGGSEYAVYIDQKVSYRDNSLKENFISKMALPSDDSEE
jgi:hypothetical protein